MLAERGDASAGESAVPAVPLTELDQAFERRGVLDEALKPLIAPLRHAAQVGRVIVFGMGRPIGAVELLPSHLHACWPDEIHWLPLTASTTVVPFSKRDAQTLDEPLYPVLAAHLARRQARRARADTGRDLHGDFVHPDWEQGFARNRARLETVTAPACAFLGVDRVRSTGAIVSGNRPLLGRHAVRGAPRPHILVPSGRGHLSPAAAVHLGTTDLLIVNLQGVRGRRALSEVRSVLAARRASAPTVIVATSPSDIFAAGLDTLPNAGTVFVPFQVAAPSEVTVTTVGRDRLAAEQTYAFAVEGLSRHSQALDRVLAQAETAWWAIRQAVDTEGQDDEVGRFLRMVDDLAQTAPEDAVALTTCREILVRAAADTELYRERAKAAVDAVLWSGGSDEILVLVRGPAAARALRAEIAAALDIRVSDLEALGVRVRLFRSPAAPARHGVAVVVGYGGLATLDAVVGSGATRIHFVFDPIEARVAWYGAERIAAYLNDAGQIEAGSAVHAIAEGLAPYVPGFTVPADLSFAGDSMSALAELRLGGVRTERPPPGEAIVYLMDGTRLDVGLQTRFEVLGRAGGYTRIVPATSLEPGDQVVLVDEDTRVLFSERRMGALDAGPLRPMAGKRAEWLLIVRSVRAVMPTSLAALGRRMAASGRAVSGAAIRSWLQPENNRACTPINWESFLTFARALGIQMPEEQIREYFQAVRTWRIRHRLAGRDLARAVRGAYVGRIGASDLARIERDWGMDARTLIDAARVGIVDEVIRPEGENDAADG